MRQPDHCSRKFTHRLLRLVVSALLASVGCTGSGGSAETSSPSANPTAALDRSARVEATGEDTAVLPPAGASGPFVGLTWPGRVVPANALLHDDGTGLFIVSLSGERTLVWDHPDVVVDAITASPGGAEIAISVRELREDLPTRGEISAWLYLLNASGEVALIDAVDRLRVIDTPSFLVAPTGRAPHLHWVRVADSLAGMDSETSRIDTEVWTFRDGQRRRVEIILRHEESPYLLSSYPGGESFTLTLLRRANEPARFEVLLTRPFGNRNTSELYWDSFSRATDTESLAGTAWLDPTQFVVLKTGTNAKADSPVRLARFDVRCMWAGGEIVYEGRDIGAAIESNEIYWSLLRAGPHSVLALTRVTEELRSLDADATGPMALIDLDSGAVTTSPVEWRSGAWASVAEAQAPSGSEPMPDCAARDYEPL